MTAFAYQHDPRPELQGRDGSDRVRLLLAGTAGGVGTTTVTALLFAAARDFGPAAPVLLDHTAGRLGHRLAGGDQVRSIDDRKALHDLGPNAVTVGVAEIGDPGAVLIVVSAATPLGCQLAGETVQAVRNAHGPDALSRTALVVVSVFGRSSIARPLAGLASSGVRAVLQLGADPALALGGRIPTGRLSRASRGFGDQLLSAVQAAGPHSRPSPRIDAG